MRIPHLYHTCSLQLLQCRPQKGIYNSWFLWDPPTFSGPLLSPLFLKDSGKGQRRTMLNHPQWRTRSLYDAGVFFF